MPPNHVWNTYEWHMTVSTYLLRYKYHSVSCCQASLQLKWSDVYPILRHQWGQEHVDKHPLSTRASRYAPRVCPTPEILFHRIFSQNFRDFFSTQHLTFEYNLWHSPLCDHGNIFQQLLSCSFFQHLFCKAAPLQLFWEGGVRPLHHQGAVPPKLASKVFACAKAIWNDFSFSCTGESKSFWKFEPKPSREIKKGTKRSSWGDNFLPNCRAAHGFEMLYLEIVGVNFFRENGLKKKRQTQMHRFVCFVNRVWAKLQGIANSPSSTTYNH